MTPTDMYDPGLSKRFMKEASAFLAGGDTAAALEALRTAWSHDPFNEELPLLCATLQLQAGDAIRAAHLALDALRVRPFYPAALDVLGVACVDALQPELAISVLEQAVALAPGLPNPAQNLKAARKAKREQAQAGVPQAEVLRSAQLLPQKGIRERIAGGKPRLSAGIVLTDGQGNRLRDCIAAVTGVASEIIVVDARRSRTDPVIRGIPGVTIHEALPAQGLAACRNEALRRASGDWVLILDADEVFQADPAALAEALADPLALAHTVVVRTAGAGAWRLPLLVRNAPGLRFTHGLDRQLLPALTRIEKPWGLEIRSEGTLSLSGPAGGAAARLPGNAEATALDQVIADDPDNLQAQVARAQLDFDAGRTQNALEALREVRLRLQQAGRDRALELEEPLLLEGACLMRMERYTQLDELMQQYDGAIGKSAGSQFLRGAAAKAAGKFEAAAALLNEALELRGEAAFCRPLADVRGPGLPTLLGATLLDTGDLKQADQAFDAALHLAPENVEAQLGKVALHLADGQVRVVLEDLDRLIEKNGANPTVWVTGGVVLGHLREFGTTAVEWLQEAQRRFPWHVEIRQRLGEAQLRNGDAESALLTWAPLGDQGTEPGALVVASLLSGKNLPQFEPECGDQVRRQVLAWFSRFMSAGSLDALDQALLNLDRADDVIPELKSRTAVWLESLGQHDAAASLRGSAPAPEAIV